jgi:hypothetical protein
MALAWEQVVVDAADPSALGHWWATALGWAVVSDVPDEVEIQPQPGVTPGLIFAPVPDARAGKNRLHLDFRPVGPDADQAAEVARLEKLGACRADVGQGDDVSWTVMADPEGNVFCVLSAPGTHEETGLS